MRTGRQMPWSADSSASHRKLRTCDHKCLLGSRRQERFEGHGELGGPMANKQKQLRNPGGGSRYREGKDVVVDQARELKVVGPVGGEATTAGTLGARRGSDSIVLKHMYSCWRVAQKATPALSLSPKAVALRYRRGRTASQCSSRQTLRPHRPK